MESTAAEYDDRYAVQFIDLLSERVGGRATSCSDEWFADSSNLVKSGRGVFQPQTFGDRGQLMDGWESRRSFGRDDGRDYDWCILRLGIPGRLYGLDIDTNHFRGNAPAYVSVEATYVEGDLLHADDHEWVEILPKIAIEANSQNLFDVANTGNWSHLRLNIFPDGGVARFRAFGIPYVTSKNFVPGEMVDLVSIMNGARSISCSDMFFSSPLNLLVPGRGINMGDGWETKRRRDDNNDWCIIRLGMKGTIRRVLLDTAHFKGNYPDSFSLQACYSDEEVIDGNKVEWDTVIDQTQLNPDKEHHFIEEILVDKNNRYSHVRLNIFPDGGVSRLRVFGFPVWWDGYQEPRPRGIDDINGATTEEAKHKFRQCCTSEVWIERMIAGIPYRNETDLRRRADEYWQNLQEKDYLEAFDGHPKIGDVGSLKAKYANTKDLASDEQTAVKFAAADVIDRLAQGNSDYNDKFGFIFIVSATGKSALEMTELLESRLSNKRSIELINAAEEQRKIFQIRLGKLL